MRGELADLTTRLAAADAAEQAALAATATHEAATARAAAHTAELRAAEAQATARTLREALDTVTQNTKDAPSRS